MDEKPAVTPAATGAGYANYAAQLAELRRKQKEAVLAGDYDKSDTYERDIQALYHKMQGGK